MRQQFHVRWILLLAMLWLPNVYALSNYQNTSTAQLEQAELPVVALTALPAEARSTFDLIKQGGPYPYQRDGVVFRNFERVLPNRPRGYYHEYTVRTPGVNTRGARRIVCGLLPECYYSADHYKTFKRIRE